MEVFVDALQSKLVQRLGTEIAVLDLRTSRVEHFGIIPRELERVRWLGATVSPDNDYLYFHRDPQDLEYLSLSSGQVLRQKIKQKARILGYHWSTETHEFVLVTAGGVRFYGLDKELGRLKKRSMYLFKVREYWVEASQQLILIQEEQHPGVLRTYSFRFSGASAASLYEGKRYVLNAPLSITTHLHNAHTSAMDEGSDTHHSIVAQLYESLYFIYYQDKQEAVYLYKLPPNGGNLIGEDVKVEGDVWNFMVVDSLLIGRSVETERICCIDVKEACALTLRAPQDQPVPSPISPSLLPFEFQFQSLSLPSLPSPLFQVLSSDLLLCKSDSTPYRLDLQTLELAKNWGNTVSQFAFLLRRANMKTQVMKFLRVCLLRGIPLTEISQLFKILSKNYAKALQEEQFNSEENRLKDGTLVISQKEIYEKVLLDVYEELKNQGNWRFLTAILLEFVRRFQRRGVRVTALVQELLAKTLLESNNFPLLHEVLSTQVFSDPQTVLWRLLTQAYANTEAGRMAIDLIWQVKDYVELTHQCLNRGWVYELMQVLERTDEAKCAQVMEVFTKKCSQKEVVLGILNFLATWRVSEKNLC